MVETRTSLCFLKVPTMPSPQTFAVAFLKMTKDGFYSSPNLQLYMNQWYTTRSPADPQSVLLIARGILLQRGSGTKSLQRTEVLQRERLSVEQSGLDTTRSTLSRTAWALRRFLIP